VNDALHRDLTDHWQTIAVTALPPGWVNVYKGPDETSYRVESCPGILVQERLKHNGHDLTERQTRAVYAASAAASPGELQAAQLYPDYRHTSTTADWAPGQPKGTE
jgi:hypothetical protein